MQEQRAPSGMRCKLAKQPGTEANDTVTCIACPCIWYAEQLQGGSCGEEQAIYL